jgi:hypothetical protein
MEAKNKQAIVGIAFGSNDAQLFPFLKSLEQTGFKGDLFLFVNNRTLLPFVTHYAGSIRYINVDKELSLSALFHKWIGAVLGVVHLRSVWIRLHAGRIRKCVHRGVPLPSWLQGLFYANAYLTVSRFVFYYNWVLNNDYGTIFFTDVNDVVFQGDIFSCNTNGRVIAFEEYAGLSLGEDDKNREWVIAGFGKDIVTRMKDAVIFCAGTILGDRKACLAFLTDFILELLKGSKPLDLNGFDQGVYNYLVSCERKAYFSASKNGEAVLTLATQPVSDIVVREGMITLKKSRTYPAVVHQYNRHPNLIDLIQNKFL